MNLTEWSPQSYHISASSKFSSFCTNKSEHLFILHSLPVGPRWPLVGLLQQVQQCIAMLLPWLHRSNHLAYIKCQSMITINQFVHWKCIVGYLGQCWKHLSNSVLQIVVERLILSHHSSLCQFHYELPLDVHIFIDRWVWA